VPKGLGVKIAERSDRNFHAKGNVWFKQLLGLFFLTLFLTCYFFDIYISSFFEKIVFVESK
jgi:hypothetical protein